MESIWTKARAEKFPRAEALRAQGHSVSFYRENMIITLSQKSGGGTFIYDCIKSNDRGTQVMDINHACDLTRKSRFSDNFGWKVKSIKEGTRK
jgi:hypothetical protein